MYGDINDYVDFTAQIGSSTQTIQAIVAPITPTLLLGLKWLRQYNPQIDWTSGTLALDGHDIPVARKPAESKIKISSAEGVEWISEKQLRKAVKNGALCYRAVLAETEVRTAKEGLSTEREHAQDHLDQLEQAGG